MFLSVLESAGSLALDLTALVKPATSARSCKLPNATDPETAVDLFKQKQCYGWWCITSMKSGEPKSTVRRRLYQ